MRLWLVELEVAALENRFLLQEEYACQAISRILQYGTESGAEVEGEATDTEVDVDVEVEDEIPAEA